MKKHMIKTLALATGMALLFTACAGSTPAPTATQPAQTENPAETPSEAPDETPSEAPSAEEITIVVGATSVPHAGILEEIVPDLKEQGINLVIQEFADYTLMNQAVFEKQLDANFFQHTPFFADYLKNSKQDLVSLGNIHIEPMGIYSKTITDLNDLTENAVVGVPNDASNEGRSLILLDANGIIKLDDNTNFECTPADIVDNPLNLQFYELEASLLPRTLDELDIAAINTNYAMEVGLNPIEDAIVMEGNDSPYANIVVVRGGEENRPELQALYRALTSEKVKTYLQDTYGDAIVPAF